MGATRATTSQGISRRTSRFESCRTIASSTVRSSADAVDLAAATARRPSDAFIFAFPYSIAPGGSRADDPAQLPACHRPTSVTHRRVGDALSGPLGSVALAIANRAD